MLIQFATCDRARALGFLKRLYPSSLVEDTPDNAGPVLGFVAKDIIRIGDPDYHSGQVFASKGAEAEVADAISALKAFHTKTLAAGRPELTEGV